MIIYAGAHHGWENTGPLIYLPKAEKLKCPAVIEDDGGYTFPQHGKIARGPEIRTFIVESDCLSYGAHSGGGSAALKHQATADLLAFLKANGSDLRYSPFQGYAEPAKTLEREALLKRIRELDAEIAQHERNLVKVRLGSRLRSS